MDPDSGVDTQRTLNLQWKSYKLVQDPGLRRVTQKIYRYDGIHFSIPVWTFYCTKSCWTARKCKACVNLSSLESNVSLVFLLGFRISTGGGLA